MDVAGQWQRQWVGAAEYGKVIEGGVTRRVTRAMEVMHASAPGARVRVMRAAYHSTAGLGVPASTFMVHSSRRVFSSGSHFLESPESQTKPLEISSTPLNSSPDSLEEENYKVTEPDDLEISEPSKWKGSTDTSSIRMPSEESSSIDNASIIDLDSIVHHITLTKKDSYDSINSEIYNSNKRNYSMRTSPILDSPITLSTLKYKSLLNSSNDWNNRRKSYSFEDTSPLHETILQTNDTMAMESSTDSGICKSTELVNDHFEEIKPKSKFPQYFKVINGKDDSETNCFRGGTNIYSQKSPIEKNITLQSHGKVSITVPVTVEKETPTNGESGVRKVKKVGFSKTELHFAAESGTVNIIATDEKPPPSCDFRKRRSAFVPINNKFDKPITLFGEKITSDNITDVNNFSNDNSDISEFDENTAATRGILKNKIPKPKPYLLGENMVIGSSNYHNSGHESTEPTAVSLINKQLQSERRYNKETTSSLLNEPTESVSNFSSRANDRSPFRYDSFKYERNNSDMQKSENLKSDSDADTEFMSAFEKRLNVLQPTQGRTKTRQLRECDLTYFGVHKNEKDKIQNWNQAPTLSDVNETTFRSVKLIQQISNSIGSETEGEDVPEYENIYIQPSYAPIPAPRSRTNYDTKTKDIKDTLIIKPSLEPNLQEKVKHESRRSRFRKHELSTDSSRSVSEPPKNMDRYSMENRPHGVNFTRPNVSDKMKRNHQNRNTSLALTHETSKPEDSVGKNNMSKSTKKTSLDRSRIRKSSEHMHTCQSPSTDSNNGSLKHQLSEQNNKKQQKVSNPYNENKLKISNERQSPDKVNTINSKTYSNKGTKEKESRSASSYRDSNRNENRKIYQKENRSPHRHEVKTINNTETSGVSKDKKTAISVKSKTKHQEISHDTSNRSRTISPIKIPEIKDSHNLRTEKDNLKTHRSKYVINYDDKNGTVSSIRKIKPRTVSPKRKKSTEEKIKGESKAHKVKYDTTGKSVRNAVSTPRKASNNLSHEDKKWKNKVRVRSCHLL